MVCEYCEEVQKEAFNFCSNCGKQNKQALLEEKDRREKGDKNLKFLSYYSIVTVVSLIAYNLIDSSKLTIIVSFSIFAIIDLVFAFYQKEVFSLFRFKRINIKVLIGTVLLCVLSGFLVDGMVDWLNTSLFGFDFLIMDEFNEFSYPIITAILLYSVFPAFFEELAFRGFVFNNLLAMRGKWPAIMGSTFLFSLVHFSFYSMLWIFPFGLFLAFLRLRYKTLLYSMVAHFTHNLTVLLIEIS